MIMILGFIVSRLMNGYDDSGVGGGGFSSGGGASGGW